MEYATKGKPRGRNGGRKASILGKVERIFVPGQLASIIREKGTGWVLETLHTELNRYNVPTQSDPYCVCGVARSEHPLCGCEQFERRY